MKAKRGRPSGTQVKEFCDKLEKYIEKNRGCRAGEMQLLIGRCRSVVNYYLAMLIESGKVYRTNRNGHWQYYPVAHDNAQEEIVTRTIGNRTVHYGTQRKTVSKSPDAMHSGNSVSGHRREGTTYA